jgi:hypothetical protein
MLLKLLKSSLNRRRIDDCLLLFIGFFDFVEVALKFQPFPCCIDAGNGSKL